MPEIVCEWCDKTIYRKPSRLKKYKHQFCSKKCHDAWQINCARKNGSSQLITCEQCGKQFHRSLSNSERMKHHYCSQECCNAWRTGRLRPEHGEKMRQILKGIRPSDQCFEAGSKAAKERLSDPEIQAKMQAGVREYYKTHPGPNKGRFGDANYNWKGGISFEPCSSEFNDILKEQIRERDNFQCKMCGMSQNEHLERYGRSLSIHHIDYDKSNSYPTNLVTLCFGCNSQANGNRDAFQELFSARIACIKQRVRRRCNSTLSAQEAARGPLPRGFPCVRDLSAPA